MQRSLIIPSSTPHQTLTDFIVFAECQIPTLIYNVTLLREKIPRDLKNPILTFLLNRTCNQILEELILRLCDGWKLLNKELRKLKQAPLSDKDPNYLDLDKMRDKLIAHKVEAGTSGKKNHTEWYAKNYGSFESVFELIKSVKDIILEKVLELEEQGLLIASSRGIIGDAELKEHDISALLSALRKEGIY